jgi:hypothetical protein
MTYWLGILLEIWILVGTWAVAWAARKLIREEKQISSPDRSFYRRNDGDLFRLIFYFILWCSTGALLYGLWIHITEHGAHEFALSSFFDRAIPAQIEARTLTVREQSPVAPIHHE